MTGRSSDVAVDSSNSEIELSPSNCAAANDPPQSLPDQRASFSLQSNTLSFRHTMSLQQEAPVERVDILSMKPMRRVFYEMERRRLERSLEGYRAEPGWGARFAAELVVVLVAFILLSNSIGRNVLAQLFPDKNNQAVFLVVPSVVTGLLIIVALIRISFRRRSAISTLAVTALLIGVVWIIWLYNPADKWPAASLKNIIMVSVIVASIEVLLLLIYVLTHFGYPCMLKRVHPDFLIKHWWRLQPVDEENAFGYSYQRYGLFSLNRNICNYHGDVDSKGRPHGFGVWTDDSRHGEILKGVWMSGYPMGPFVSREFSSGSVSVCRRILWASTRAEPGIDCKYIFPHRIDSCLYGLASVECSVSGYFFNHLPKVRELVTRTSSFEQAIDHFKREFEKTDEELVNVATETGFLELLPPQPCCENSDMLWQGEGARDGKSGRVYSCGHASSITAAPSYLMPVRNAEALVYLHGYNCPISSAIKRLGQMLALGQFPLWIRPFVFSQGTGSALTYHAARDCLVDYAPDLADFVSQLRGAGFRRIHFLVHSMGARLFCDALPFMIQDSLVRIRASTHTTSISAMSTPAGTFSSDTAVQSLLRITGTCIFNRLTMHAGQEHVGMATFISSAFPARTREERATETSAVSDSVSPLPCHPIIDLEAAQDSKGDRMTLLNVILVNADYPLDKFRYTVLPSLLEYCERVTVYSDSRDGALMWSELFNREKALGKFVGTLSCVDEQSGHTYGEAYVDVMDTTHMDQNVHQLRHNFFNLNVQVVSDIAEIVQSCTPAAKRSTRLTKTGRGNVFTFLSPPSFVKNN